MPLGYTGHLALALREHYRQSRNMAARAPLPGPVTHTAGKEPLYIVLALGESLRADHLRLYGYARDTTPYTAATPLLRFATVYSAGTGTLESVTRLMTRATISHTEPALHEKSLIHLFRRAGFRTAWLTNQGSMAGAETPITAIAREAEIHRTHPGIYTINAKLKDSDLLPMLDEVLTLPPRDTLIVLHSYGSHFHPEDRYDEKFRTFTPICNSFSAADCSEESLINSYDNSVIATNYYWQGLIERLKNKQALLIITSDHGMRLRGEVRGSDAHAQNSPALRNVPLIVYASPALRQTDAYQHASALQKTPVSHDVLFHSLLGAARISTPAYEQTLDIFHGDVPPYTDPFVELPGALALE